MIFRASLLIFIFLITGVTFAMDWPLLEAKVTQNFGANDQGAPDLGTMLEGEGLVFAAGPGEIVFSSSGKETASRLPSPLGAWSAIAHNDGLVSIYSRYRDEGRTRTEGSMPQGFVELGTPIARAGVSGWSKNNGVYYILYDRREKRWVNALMVITMPADTAEPSIWSVQLQNSNGKLLEGGQIRNISQGRYSIIVNATDALLDPRGPRLPPHRILCSVNGEEIGSLSLDTMNAKDGVLMVNRNGQAPAKRVYANYPAFEIGEVQFNRGQANLEIIVQDLAGNSRSSLIRIIVE
jgi:murein DD-endopeptidase MepM/ murein hydrolase activator NlpD